LTIPSWGGIVNGSFEDPFVPVFGLFAPGDPIGGLVGTWRAVGSGNVILLNSAYTEPRPPEEVRFDAQDGVQALDLTGPGNQLEFGNITGIRQLVATVPLQQYVLSFYVGNQDSTIVPRYQLPSSIRLFLDLTGTLSGHQSVGVFTNSDSTLNNVNWKLFTYTFEAQANFTDIMFTNETYGGEEPFDDPGDNYAGLDNVSLQSKQGNDDPVPEPGSVLLLAGGLAAVLLRRRIR